MIGSKALPATTAALLLLAGCSDGVSDTGAARFVSEVKANVPGANAYTDDQLRSMASNVCSIGRVDRAVQVLDNFSQIEAEDREEVAEIALRTACEQ